MKAKQKELYKAIASILWHDWDPIGVNYGEDEWNDEYDSYVPHVFKLVLEDKDVSNIAQYLSSSIKQNMSCSAPEQHNLKIAHKIVDAKKHILG
ncbi:hypothetical protein [Pseudoalteromonas rubra]|uniref:DUF1871 domain-containing protein n=1 Tax=Pseudoalteromonas rubra TaxID=43658 RepID=A0A0U3IFP0_9GAMM|nr:hypothetical protein [Pseudoalteromonas rubra]ALU45863.1 hypothetical protein AT705_23340 [Pseudoalteromonas rubra]